LAKIITDCDIGNLFVNSLFLTGQFYGLPAIVFAADEVY